METIAAGHTSPIPRNDETIAAGPALNHKPLQAPALCPRSGNEDQSVHRRIPTDEDMAEPAAADDAQIEQGPEHTVRRHQRRKKNNKISGTLLPSNGGLIGHGTYY